MLRTLYFFITLGVTTIGALTGMGGGVILKPVLDALGDFDVSTINLLSSVTVFIMSLVTVIKQYRQKTVIDFKKAIPLALGSLLGGHMGNYLLMIAIKNLRANHLVIAIQNLFLTIIILAVFFYMNPGKQRFTLGCQGVIPTILIGILLGVISAFLGIGGGPINVALMIFVFSYEMKTAAVYSIITILFSQASKLVVLLLSGDIFSHNLSMLPYMVVAATLGGWIGSMLSKKSSVKTVELAFNCIQILVFAICLSNIIRNLYP